MVLHVDCMLEVRGRYKHDVYYIDLANWDVGVLLHGEVFDVYW